MQDFLARTDILICLLPLTDSTCSILIKPLFDRLPAGAVLINVARGGHLVQEDLLQALDEGRLSSAILDVCEPEPLPQEHPFWMHPKVMLTPHIASMTQPETALDAVIDNICRRRKGVPMIGQAWRSTSISESLGFDETTNFIKFFKHEAGSIPDFGVDPASINVRTWLSTR